MSLAPDVLPSAGQVRAADPAQVRAAASAARSTQRQLDRQLRALSANASAWAGPASAAASTRHTEISVVGDVLADALGHLAAALERVADEVDAARHLLAHADLLCGQAGGHVTDVGGIVGLLDPGVESVIRATVLEARRRYAGSAL